MDQDDQDFVDQMRALLEDVPPAIRSFILNELPSQAERLTNTYRLHADQGGLLERELLLMLAGEEQPSDFSKELTDAGIPADTVRNIITDVNENIFKKLQAAELEATPQEAPAEPKPAYRSEPARVAMPVMQVASQSAAPVPPVTAAPSVPSHINLIQAEPAVVPPSSAQAPISMPASPAMPEMRTMASDINAIEHPSAPALATFAPATVRSTMPIIPNPAHVSPARTFQTASVPFTSIPTASQPISEISAPAPVSGIATYSSDPYREPVE